MIARVGTGWQYALADLSLILFMVTGAALAQAQAVSSSESAQPSLQGEALALWRSVPDAPPLGEWLAAQSPDARQQLTIVSRYGVGGQAGALERARALAASAGDAGAEARIIIEPGEGGAAATLAYDVPAAALARGVREAAATSSQRSQP